MSFSLTQFGRSGPHDDRRRRLLTENRSPAGGAAAPIASPASRVVPAPVHKTERYGDALFLDQQPAILDFLPRRLLGWALCLVAGLVLIAGIEALYVWMPRLTAALGQRAAGTRIAALDLAGKGSLAEWFSSLALLAASVLAVLVYSVRRHRMDDYRGYYRVWLWAALCWFLMATDAAASLHEGFRDLMTLVTGTPLLGDGSIWWLIAYALLLGSIGARLLIDMWPCRLSMSALVLAGSAYVVFAVMQLGWGSVEPPARRIMIQQGAAMAGHLLLLLAMGLQARYVLLDARGLLPPRRRKSAATGDNERTAKRSTAADDAWVAVDSPHGSPQPVLRRASAVVPAAAPAAAPSAAPPAQEKLSKADRKALKRRLLEERRNRQKEGGAWGG